MVIVFLWLAGCKQSSVFNANETVRSDVRAEAMIVLTNERNRYEAVYTDEIWKVPVGTSGINFEEYLAMQVTAFMQELENIVDLAEEHGIVLDKEEERLVSQAALEYYDSLTSSDISYMGIKKEDVISLYTKYCLANKTVGELTKNIDLEVSDSEARVCEVYEIFVTDRAEAEEAYAQVTEEKADFETVARKYSKKSQIRRQIARGESDEALENVIFALEDGDISPVVETDGGYSVFYSIEDYDEEATLLRKQEISDARKNTAFLMVYEAYQQSHPDRKELALDLESVEFSPKDNVKTDQFFEIYKEYFTMRVPSSGYVRTMLACASHSRVTGLSQ